MPDATGGLCPACLLRQSLAALESPEPEGGAADMADAVIAAGLAWTRTPPEAELRALAGMLG